MSKHALQALDEAIDAVASIELKSLDRSARQAVVLRLETARTRLDAVSARALGCFDFNGRLGRRRGQGCGRVGEESHRRLERRRLSRVRLAAAHVAHADRGGGRVSRR